MSAETAPPEPFRVADALVRALCDRGVSRVFALSGNQIMPLFDACLGAGLEVVHTRHEAACVYMAEAHAQLTGELGVALVTAGVGLGNAVGPLYCALASETPLLLLSGDSPQAQDGRGAFQELDQTTLTQPVTRFCARPTSAAALRADLGTAHRIATGSHPGPVHLALPADVLNQPFESTTAAEPSEPDTGSSAERAEVTAVAASLASATQPLIVLGPALNATRQPGLVAALERATGAPTVVAESPRGLKDPGYANLGAAISNADTVLLLGKPCDFSLGFGGSAAPGSRWMLVHANGAVLQQATSNLAPTPLHGVQTDPISFARHLGETGPRRPAPAWRTRCDAWLAPLRTDTGSSDAGAMHPAAVCHAVQTALDRSDNALLITDGGEFGQWAQACCRAPRRLVNGVAGSIGGAIPAAVAASLADPTADIVVLMGDGSAGFHLMELDTAVRVGARFHLIIGNDRRWNAEHQIQLRDYGSDRLIGCELGETDYAAVARGLGAAGERVSTVAALTAALTRRVSGPVCVDTAIESVAAPAPV
ncbi:MAG: thiamine pyrophosphate-binding protein [Pseudomonadota bacterium]